MRRSSSWLQNGCLTAAPVRPYHFHFKLEVRSERRQADILIFNLLPFLICRCLEPPSIPLDGDLDIVEIGFLISVIETQRHGPLFHSPVNKAAGPSFRNSSKV